MWSKTYAFGDGAPPLRVVIEQDPVYERQDGAGKIAIFGNIFNLQDLDGWTISGLDQASFIDRLATLSGYFLVIWFDAEKQQVSIANDVMGNFRLYYHASDRGITLSDGLDRVHAASGLHPGERELVEEELRFFKFHYYTTGGGTSFSHIQKMLPASLWKYAATGLDRQIYFGEIASPEPDVASYSESMAKTVKSNIRDALDPDLPNILYFTGGVDSTYLALCLQEMEIKFYPVFVRYDPPDYGNSSDYYSANVMAGKLGLDLEIVELKLDRDSPYQDVAFKRHPFDSAFATTHYQSGHALLDKYGRCNIINGQSSDSIFCWGASTPTIGGFLQRYVVSKYYYNAAAFIRALASKLITAIYRRRWPVDHPFRLSVDPDQYIIGLLDPQGYLPVSRDIEGGAAYYAYLARIANDISGQLGHRMDKVIMYMKLMYLQGTSNISVIESCREYDHKVVAPFIDGRIVQMRMDRQNDLLNLFKPRYVLIEYIKKHHAVELPQITKKLNSQLKAADTGEFRNIELEFKRSWLEKLISLY
ncbi:MAG: hypothetical protein IIA59_13135 [Candidatus Marinimicrobia bacterium]|nr:hypothetical protein [Candidatus Neomarinimicrobiota bacterium]